MIVMFVTAMYAARQDDEMTRSAADVLCQDLKQRITGQRPSGKFFRSATKLGEAIADGGFAAIAGVGELDIMQSYEV